MRARGALEPELHPSLVPRRRGAGVIFTPVEALGEGSVPRSRVLGGNGKVCKSWEVGVQR